jgi:uncharacterized membrane protein YdjX (TVP38/TMEM64 family)
MSATQAPDRPPDDARAGHAETPRWHPIGLALATIAAGALLVAVVPWLRHAVGLTLDGNFAGLRDYIRSLGLGGPVLLLALMVMHAVISYPSEIVTATAGFAYGWFGGLTLAMAGWLVSALASYALGRWLGGPLLRSLLGARYRRFEHAVQGADNYLLVSARLIPIVPFSFVGYAAGAARISLWRFTWTTAVGFLPLTVAVSFLGSRARTFPVDNPLVWLAVAVLVGLLVLGHVASRRSRTARPARPARPATRGVQT